MIEPMKLCGRWLYWKLRVVTQGHRPSGSIGSAFARAWVALFVHPMELLRSLGNVFACHIPSSDLADLLPLVGSVGNAAPHYSMANLGALQGQSGLAALSGVHRLACRMDRLDNTKAMAQVEVEWAQQAAPHSGRRGLKTVLDEELTYIIRGE